MVNEGELERINDFKKSWRLYTRNSVMGDFHRSNLRSLFLDLKAKLEKPQFDAYDVLDSTERLLDQHSEFLSPRLEVAYPGSIATSIQWISNHFQNDKQILKEREDLFTIFRRGDPLEDIEDEITKAGYDFNYLKENAHNEMKSISDKVVKESLSIASLQKEINEIVSNLQAVGLKAKYIQLLVDKIETHLFREETSGPIRDILRELIGELHTRGWEEDSFKEAIKQLESIDDISSFCEMLRCKDTKRNYCVPLPHTEIPVSHIEVGGVHFHLENSSDFTFLDELWDANERTSRITEYITTGTELFAVLQVKAPTKQRGEVLMEYKLERAIDAMNLGKEKGVIQSPFTEPQTKYICRLEDGSYYSNVSKHSKYSPPHNFRIRDEEAWLQLMDDFSFFERPERDRSELENRFVQSYRWYGDAIQSGIFEDELIKYIISMESMMVPEGGLRKRSTLAQRLMDLLGIYEQYRDGFRREVISLYQTRNLIVHSAEINIQGISAEVDSARETATRMFGAILDNYIDKHREVESFLDDISSAETPVAPDDHNPFRVG